MAKLPCPYHAFYVYGFPSSSAYEHMLFSMGVMRAENSSIGGRLLERAPRDQNPAAQKRGGNALCMLLRAV